ncbi:hypothetical protein HK405_007646, partial [Cladochytrium tenue]
LATATTAPPDAAGAATAASSPRATIEADGTLVVVNFPDGARTAFHTIWLRDHCRCEQCFHPKTLQRLLDTSQIPLDIKAVSATVTDGGSVLAIAYSGTDHKSTFSLDWLRLHSYNPKVRLEADEPKRNIRLWGAELAENLPVVPYDELSNSLNVKDEYGIGFVSGVPATPEDTERVARRISFIRESHYGTFWDFSADNAHGDTAYTNIPLPAHTDTTYFTDPVGIQLFHLLEHRGEGGASLYVDGFNAAAQLREQDPESYALLSRVRVPAHCAGDADVLIAQRPGAPILEHDAATGTLARVRHNNDDRSALSGLADAGDVPRFYAALRAWTRCLRDARNEVWTRLGPGTVVAMDNWRVLHGRAGFSGFRRMCGSYHGHDDYRSRVATLVYGAERQRRLL